MNFEENMSSNVASDKRQGVLTTKLGVAELTKPEVWSVGLVETTEEIFSCCIILEENVWDIGEMYTDKRKAP